MLEEFGNIDIYLLDQLMKGRINKNMRILDAGCGSGRNSYFFIRQGMDVYGIDDNEKGMATLWDLIPQWNPNFDRARFLVSDIIDMPHPDQHFDYIICNAVLHFAKNSMHFMQLFDELMRVLRPKGILFIRMTSKHTVEHLIQLVEDGVYQLPDGSTRYLLDIQLLAQLIKKYNLKPIEQLKTTNVANLRSMTTLVLQKVG
ncbi:MAG: class I SAM-dependent methyltransferase [Aureispira sp.]|nr:class I SAM-dependent methyltransferase [Aureispira sp.]